MGGHVAYLWRTETEFEEAVGFLEVGLRRGEHLVVFGHDEANRRVLEILEARGADVEALRAGGRLDVLGAGATGDATLAGIGASFQAAVDAGAPMIRLLGNIGWGKDGWPDTKDLLRFEARVTAAAASFPCVVVCMYDIGGLPGEVIVHGAFQTHPITFCGNLVRENPFHCSLDEFLERVDRL